MTDLKSGWEYQRDYPTSERHDRVWIYDTEQHSYQPGIVAKTFSNPDYPSIIRLADGRYEHCQAWAIDEVRIYDVTFESMGEEIRVDAPTKSEAIRLATLRMINQGVTQFGLFPPEVTKEMN